MTLTVDHVIPQALGGGDDPRNLVTACQPCNAGKAATSPDDPLVADVDATALLFARAVERAAAIRRQELEHIDRTLLRFENDVWGRWTAGEHAVPMPTDWRSSIERFLAEGVTLDELDYFVETAMGARVPAGRVFRYFCGCVWNEIGRRHELARRLIEDGEV